MVSKPYKPLKLKHKYADRADCFRPLRRSRCRALLSFWFFNNHSKRCQEYKFGGCGEEGQENRFSTEEQCEQICTPGILEQQDFIILA